MYIELLGEAEVLWYNYHTSSLSEKECQLIHFGIHLCVDSNNGKAHHILKVEEIYGYKQNYIPQFY